MQPVFRVQLVLKDLQGRVDQPGHKDHKGHKESQVLKDHRALLV